MSILESVRVALGALGANKLRTCLTMLGIIIGVGAVIAMMSIGQGAQQQVTTQIKSLGTNLLFVRPGSTQQAGVRSAQGSAVTLTLEDAEALPQRVPSVVATAPEQTGFGQLLANGQNASTRVTGTTPSYESVRNANVANGEFISRTQLEGNASVVVLGSNVAANLFGDDDPIGQTVRVSFNNRVPSNYRVIGVMEPKGGTGFGNQDDQVFVPITTMQARLVTQRNARGGANVSVINVQVAEEAVSQEVVDQIAEVLRERHRTAEDDFTIQSQEDFLTTFTQVTQTFTILLGSVAGISLLVGGIGIMNIMLVSVTERTREIGIRKAVGARRRDIQNQFLVEAVTVSLCGGLIGVLLGSGISRLISGIQLPVAGGAQGLQTVVSPQAVLLAFFVSAAVGIFFGFYPASRAARLHPIEALRYE
ncbi:MAG TPA: ABC transporter permease [Chloroflexota bacterium]|nr:ABC transporter permease [Chloroflexota bacterium]